MWVVEGEACDEFSTLVRNTRPLAEIVTELTGLTAGDLADAPKLSEALGEFVAWVGGDPLVAHNGLGYDFVVLHAACLAEDLPIPPGFRLDTLELAHVAFPRAGEGIVRDVTGERPPANRRLGGLAEYLGVTVDSEGHRALPDARALARLVGALVEVVSGDTPRWRLVRHLLDVCGHPWAGFLDEPGDRPELAEIVPEVELPQRPAPTHELDVDATVAQLEPGGRLLRGERSHRPQQVQMARRVAWALGNGEVRLIEAPTGTGKTLAYVVSALAFARAAGRPVIVASHSKVLQDQVLATLERLGDELGPIASVVLKGRHNYCSLEVLAGMLEESPADPEEGLALAVIASWTAVTPTGDWDDLRVWAIEQRMPVFARLRWSLRVERAITIPVSPLEHLDFYRRAVERVAEVDVAVLNHALLVSRRDWLDHCHHLIVDEAHNLEDSVTAAGSETVSERDLEQLLDTVHDPARRWGTLARWCDATGTSVTAEVPGTVTEATGDARGAAASLAEELLEFLRARSGARRVEIERFGSSYRLRGYDVGSDVYRPVRNRLRQIVSALRRLAEALQRLEVPAEPRGRYSRRRLEQELSRVGRSLRESAELLYEVGHAADAESWINVADLAIEDGDYTWQLRRVPLTVSPALRDVWRELEAVVLTSATLRVDDSFDYILDRLGLPPARTTALATPFAQLSDNQLVVLTNHLPAPTGSPLEEFAHAQAEELARLLTLTRGRTLALFAARERMRLAHEHVQPLLEEQGIRVLCQGDAPSPALVERLRSEVPTSLLATRSFWEGVDVPGEALSLLAIEKLPFDPPVDPVVTARVEILEQQGRDPFGEYLVPTAVIRFAQGVGRLIRSETDVGVVVVLDKRLRRPVTYRDSFLTALPGPPTVHRPETPEDAYARIAEHLGLLWDASVRRKLASLPGSDPWADLAGFVLDDAEAADPEVVRARLEEVRELLGFERWRPGQVEVMTRLIAGEDVISVLPTGSGKSITYQLPALLRDGLTLVVSPLIALMRDQVRGLRWTSETHDRRDRVLSTLLTSRVGHSMS